MKIIIITLCLATLLFPGINDKNYGSALVDSVTSIYDGDTFRAVIKDFPDIIGSRIPIRISGVDTPEMKDKRPAIKKLARKAKQYTVKRLREGKVITLENMKRGKYFRIVADVIIDGKSLGQELLDLGLAKPYGGGKKQKW